MKKWNQSKFQEVKLKHFFIILRVVTTEINYSFMFSRYQLATLCKNASVMFLLAGRSQIYNNHRNVDAEKIELSRRIIFAKTNVQYFNFAKWKLCVICKLHFPLLLCELRLIWYRAWQEAAKWLSVMSKFWRYSLLRHYKIVFPFLLGVLPSNAPLDFLRLLTKSPASRVIDVFVDKRPPFDIPLKMNRNCG